MPWLEEAWVVKSAVVATPPPPHKYCLDGEVIAAATRWERAGVHLVPVTDGAYKECHFSSVGLI